MKTYKISILFAATVIAALALADSALGQPRRPITDRPGPGRAEPGSFAGPGRFGPGVDRVLELLTEEQRASLREVMEPKREPMRVLEEKIRTGRAELFLASLTGSSEEEKVRSKAMAVAKLEVDLLVLRSKAFARMRPPLSSDQIEQVKRTFPAADTRSSAKSRGAEVERDEHGLPPKDRVPAEPKFQKP